MKARSAYIFLMILSILDILAIAGIFLLNLFHYQNYGIDKTWLYVSGGAIVVLLILRKPLDSVRFKARAASSLDEYGRSKKIKTYERMSNKEQAELDKIRMMEMERVLPTTVINEMMHKGSADPDADMDALIGLSSVKNKMLEMAARMEFESENRIKRGDSAMHMCFFGPPGTGKTTCARIITGFLHKYGYVKKNRVIEVDGNFLADQNASAKTEMLVRNSYGGVLFIDEAYSLLNNYSGQEAIATLIKQMEDNRDKFILILAGYEDEMKNLIKSNPGFSSRIKDYFYFDSYSIDELGEIFKSMAKHEGFTVSDDALDVFGQIMEEAKKDYHFGNARTVRNVLDKSINRHSLNYKQGRSPEKFRLDAGDIIYETMDVRMCL